ncbi:hypothetical protein [Streptomyces sp. 4F14]|uniref:hypothetical protein n=1 Tax=Streptomyces sp. 4F14 TaxID=3394380 RepID=UPI003A8B97E8
MDGPVAPGAAFDPDDVAERYWELYSQPRGARALTKTASGGRMPTAWPTPNLP